ncbi:hypothetical protein BKA69DRAFT_371165 [Paraphysoderma sedebokerense]|nr:hypothetical protein BKA69DRAFT_371165 [Paraphysoderma sedebokerense]
MSALAQVCNNNLTPVSEQDQDAPVKNVVMSGSSQDDEVEIIRVVEGRRKLVVDLTGSSEDESEEVKDESDGFKIIDLTGPSSDDDSNSEKTGGLVKQNHIIDLCGDDSDEEDFSCPRKRPKLLEQKDAVQFMYFLPDSCTSKSLPFAKGSIESCFESLSKSSLEPLMKKLGLPKSDSKVRVAETFVAFIAKHVPPTYRFVCCIDVGSRNLAWIIYDIQRNCIVQWKKLDIKEKVTVAAYHSKLSTIVPKEIVLPCTSVLN